MLRRYAFHHINSIRRIIAQVFYSHHKCSPRQSDLPLPVTDAAPATTDQMAILTIPESGQSCFFVNHSSSCARVGMANPPCAVAESPPQMFPQCKASASESPRKYL